MTDCEIFFLSARITVKQGMIKKFSGIASEVDKANEQTEKGRIFFINLIQPSIIRANFSGLKSIVKVKFSHCLQIVLLLRIM